MKTILNAQVSGSILRFSLHEFMPKIELSKNYRVLISEIQPEKITDDGNDLSVSFDVATAAENLGRECDRLERIDHQAMNAAYDCEFIETPDGVVQVVKEQIIREDV